MLNILSCVPGQRIQGKVIKEWIIYHTEHETSHTKEASKMKKFLDIDDNAYYTVGKQKSMSSLNKFCIIKTKKL